MIPQIARELLKAYGKQDGWLLDPYCGTGASLVEASLFGITSVGCDINPLVRFIATANPEYINRTAVCRQNNWERILKFNKALLI